NAVATVVMAKLEGELDVARMRAVLAGDLVEDYPIAGETASEAPRGVAGLTPSAI
ncbi:MAG: hypothetical protein JWQ05_496, partial [Methylobacterium sp.]|nr:hypothetical protein [Methylobacterium sp.]